jgi:glycosyltransferase involved in cell wall biosynthesis
VTGVPESTDVTLVLPCLDEAAGLPWILSRLPEHVRAIVADNGSTDGSVEVARDLGAHVVHATPAGYGAACHAGIAAATSDVVAVMDCDATLDPAQLPPLIAAVAAGSADMAVCRRRPSAHAWPWHARVGTAFLAWRLRRATTLTIHDLPPVRVFRRDPYLALGIEDRAFGYPMEVLARAAAASWTVTEFDMDYRPRIGRSKVSGTVRGSVRATTALLRAAPRRG